MSVTKELKTYLLGTCDMDLVGIAPASALSQEPEGHRPTDILPGAKSIIVFGRRLTDGAIQAAFRKHEDGNTAALSGYAAYASDLAPNFLLVFNTFNISQYIERTFGETAFPLPCGPLQSAASNSTAIPLFAGPYRDGLPMNIEKAAMAAGLGEFGWSNYFLTPEYGPRVQFGAVLTTMALQCDEPYHGKKLCNPETCDVCVKRCPTCAIPAYGAENSVSKAVEGKCVEVSNLKFNRCVVASCALKKEFSGRFPEADLVDSYDPSESELEEAFKNKKIASLSMDHYPKYFCDKCMLYCPTGNWEARFRETGLTKL